MVRQSPRWAGGAKVQRCRGAQVHRCTGAQVHRCTGAQVHSAERIRWCHDMQWHHTDSRRSARQASPGSTSQVFLSFREFCTASKVAWRRTLFPWDKAIIGAYVELCAERTGRARTHSQLPFDVRVQCLSVCYSSYVSTSLPTCVGDAARARRARFRRAVPPLRRKLPLLR